MAQYVVKSGDTLWGIAQRLLGDGNRWRELGYTGDPRKMPVGTVLSWGQPAPQAAAPAPAQPAAPAGPTPEQILAAQETAKYNELIAENERLKQDWRYAIDPTDVLGNQLMDQFLTTASSNPYLDPYYNQRVESGAQPEFNRDALLAELLKNPELISRFGTKWLEALGISAQALNQNDYDYTAQAHARDYLGQARSLADSAASGLEGVTNQYADRNIRGGMRNAAVEDVMGKAGGAAANMNANEADWRRSYTAGNQAGITGYAQQYRNDISKTDWAATFAQSGIKNQDLRNKFIANASQGWT